jgi:hypothetical protein
MRNILDIHMTCDAFHFPVDGIGIDLGIQVEGRLAEPFLSLGARGRIRGHWFYLGREILLTEGEDVIGTVAGQTIFIVLSEPRLGCQDQPPSKHQRPYSRSQHREVPSPFFHAYLRRLSVFRIDDVGRGSLWCLL